MRFPGSIVRTDRTSGGSRAVMALAAMLACSLAAAQNPASVLGRYVRVEHRDDQPAAIELAEMQVLSSGANIASMGEASQSGSWGGFGAELAIDGVEDGNVYYNRSTALTPQPPVVHPFWELTFPKPARIESLVLYFRPEDGCVFRNDGVWVSILNSDRNVIWEQQITSAPRGPAFRIELPVKVLNAANNPALAAAEILAVPTAATADRAAWDVPPGGPAGTQTIAFSGGRVQAGGAQDPSELAIIFGTAAAPFRFSVRMPGLTVSPRAPTATDNLFRFRGGENDNWKAAEALVSPLHDGARLDVTVDWKTEAFTGPLVDLALGNPTASGSGWLGDARYEGERYAAGRAFGFVAPVTRHKPLIGGHPLRSVFFTSPQLGNRRLLITQPASPGRVTLATEADNVTHLCLEPRLVGAGRRHCYSLEIRFPQLPAVADATATKLVALPKDRALLQGKFTLSALGNGSVIPEFQGMRLLNPVQGAYTREGATVTFGEAGWQSATLVREYGPPADPKAIGRVVFRAQNADIRVEQTATLGWHDDSGQFLRCPYQIETSVEALRPGIRDFRLDAGLDRYRMRINAMQIDDWMETDMRARAIPDRELVLELKPDRELSFGGAELRLTALSGRIVARASERDASVVLALPDLGPGVEMKPGTRHALKLQAEVTSLNDCASPIRVLHPGRRNPYFTLPEPALLQVRTPAGAGAPSVLAKDGESGAALAQRAVLTPKGAIEGDFGRENAYECRLDRERAGVTALEFRLTGPNGQVETRTFEVAHIGSITAAPQVAADLPDEELLNLERIDAVDCAAPSDPHPRLDFPGQSEVVDTCIGKARRIGERGATMIWEIQVPPESINRPHLLVAEYPDDARRNMSMNVFETADQIEGEGAAWNTRGLRDGMGTGVQTGWPFPLSRQARKMSLLWWPAHRTAYVGISCCINPEWFHASVGNACVKRLTVYRVKGELPAVRPAFEAPGRRIGGHAEDSDFIQSDFRGLADPDEGPSCYAIPGRWSPRYLAKYYNSWEHYLQYLRFVGQNLDASSVHRYSMTLYPGGINGAMHDYSSVDQQELLARMAGANGAGVILNMHASHDLSQRMPQLVEEEEERIAANPNALEPTIAFIDCYGRRTTGAHQGASRLNFNAPEVRRELRWLADDIARRYSGVPGVLGVGCLAGEWLYPTYLPGGFEAWDTDWHLTVSYDDRTIAQFERETGVKIPVAADDAQRYRKRFDWLMANARKQWIDWRCRLVFSMADDMRKAVAARGLPFWFTGFAQHATPWMERLALEQGGLSDALKTVGYDPPLYRGIPGLHPGWTFTECMDTRNSPRGRNWIGEGLRQAFLEDPTCRQALPHGPDTTAYLFNAFRENPFPTRPWVEPLRWRQLCIGKQGGLNLKGSAQYVWPAPGFGARDFVMMMAAGSPPATIMHTWMDCGFSQIPSQDIRRFSLAFRTLPLVDYATLTGNGLDRNLVVRQGVFEGSTYFFVINPTWSDMKVELRLTGQGEILELVRGAKLRVGAQKPLVLALKPYDLQTFRIEKGVTLAGATAEPSAAGLAECGRRLDEAAALLDAWGAALSADDPNRQVVAREVAAGRARLGEHDLRGAVLHADGWRLRAALQRLLPPPGYAVAAAPAADEATELLLHLDEEAGAIADSGGKKRGIQGTAAPVAGRFGKALDMRQGGLKAGLPGVLTDGGSWSFECWVTPTSNWAANTAVPVAALKPYFVVRWGPAQWGGMRELPMLNVEVEDGKGMPVWLGVHAPCQPGVWYHLAVVYDKDAPRDNVKVYVNGRLEDFETTPNGRPLASVKDAPGVLEFGQGPFLLDEVRVSSKSRTLRELGYPADRDSRSWSDRLRE